MAAVAAVKEAMRQVDPDQGAAEILSMEQLVSGSIAGPRLQAMLLGAFGALGLLLACVGDLRGDLVLGGAAGARDGDPAGAGRGAEAIRAMVLREGMPLAAAGVAVGVLAALALTRYLATLLYTVKPTDPAVFAAVSALLVAVAAAGCWFPARRATAVDPAMVLREE